MAMLMMDHTAQMICCSALERKPASPEYAQANTPAEKDVMMAIPARTIAMKQMTSALIRQIMLSAMTTTRAQMTAVQALVVMLMDAHTPTTLTHAMTTTRAQAEIPAL